MTASAAVEGEKRDSRLDREPLGRPARPLILTAAVGGGHDSAAYALETAVQAEWPEARVEVVSAIPAFRWGLGSIMSTAYQTQLRRMPWSYGLWYELVRRSTLFRWICLFFLRLVVSAPLLRLIQSYEPDLVISTYPGVNMVLGGLRRRGRLTIPAAAVLTDLGGFELWVHKGIDLHLVMSPACLGPVARLAGLGAVRVVKPVVRPEFYAPVSQPRARQALGLPATGPVVLVTGGAWGVGDYEGAIETSLRLPGVTVICVTGRNEVMNRRLRARFDGEPRVWVFGFTSRMNELMVSADVVIHPTGGVTALEALVRKRPIVAYRVPPGHMRRLASFMGREGFAAVADSPADLERLLPAVLEERPEPAFDATHALSAVTALQNLRPLVKRMGFVRRWSPRLAITLLLLVSSFGLALTLDEPYPVVAKAMRLSEMDQVTGQNLVGLVILAHENQIATLAAELEMRSAHASFALHGLADPYTADMVAAAGGTILPALVSTESAWFKVGRELQQSGCRTDHGPFLYVPARPSPTLGEYLLARRLGGLPVRAAWIRARTAYVNANRLNRIRAGSVVVLRLEGTRMANLSFLDGFLKSLSDRGLSPVPVPLPPAVKLPPGIRS